MLTTNASKHGEDISIASPRLTDQKLPQASFPTCDSSLLDWTSATVETELHYDSAVEPTYSSRLAIVE